MHSEQISDYLAQLQKVIEKTPVHDIEMVIDVIQHARTGRKNIFILGNGGSASTASHFTCDLNKQGIKQGLPHFKAICLSDNTPNLTAWSNDVSYQDCFSKQLENFIEKDDVVIGITSSGNSENVIRALNYAKTVGAETIAFSGFDGGKVRNIAKLCVIVPSQSVPQIEDMHLILEHLITECLRH